MIHFSLLGSNVNVQATARRMSLKPSTLVLQLLDTIEAEYINKQNCVKWMPNMPLLKHDLGPIFTEIFRILLSLIYRIIGKLNLLIIFDKLSIIGISSASGIRLEPKPLRMSYLIVATAHDTEHWRRIVRASVFDNLFLQSLCTVLT